MLNAHEYTLVSLNEFVCNYNPIWKLGLFPVLEENLAIAVRRTKEPEINILIPFDSMNSEQFDVYQKLTLSQKKNIQFQLCLSQIDSLQKLLESTVSPVQLWIHRDLTQRELELIEQFIARLHLVFIFSSDIDFEALFRLRLFKKLSFFMPQKRFFSTTILDIEEAYEQFLILKKQFLDMDMSTIAFKNLESHLSHRTITFLKHPNIENFKRYLKEKNWILYLYFWAVNFGRQKRVKSNAD